MKRKTATARKQRFPGNIAWKWRDKFQAPAAGRIKQNYANGREILFQRLGTEKLEYLERSPVVPENVARSICI